MPMRQFFIGKPLARNRLPRQREPSCVVRVPAVEPEYFFVKVLV